MGVPGFPSISFPTETTVSAPITMVPAGHPDATSSAFCLESSLAWGLLGLFFFYFLDIRVRAAVISLPGHVGTVLAVGLTMFYLVDFIHCFRLRMGGMEEEDEPAVGRLKIY